MASLKDDQSWRCRICLVERLVGRRTQAALTAGVLAVVSVAPTAAFAQQGAIDGSAVSDTAPADFDIGGASDDLAEEAAGEPAVDVSAPQEQAGPPAAEVPSAEPAAPVPDVESVEDPEVAEPEPIPEPEVPAPSPEGAPPAPVATAEPAPPLAAESAPNAEDVVEPRSARRSKTQQRRKAPTTPRVVPAAPPAAQPATPAAGQSEAPPAVAPTVVATTPAPAAAPARHAARATGGWHVIQRGESLWSIAAERLGSGASTASIAAEVERLWALNQDRIGTGNRDVVLTGTRIKL